MSGKLGKTMCIVAAVCAVAMSGSRGFAATPQQVDDALNRAKAWVYGKQKDGNWEDSPTKLPAVTGTPLSQSHQWGGLTSVMTYALLASGESDKDPRIQQAVTFLSKADLIGTYALGMRANVYHLLPETPEVRRGISKDGELLTRLQKKTGPALGMFDYTVNTNARFDHSVSQYGILGLWACADAGLEIPSETWERTDKAWRKNQQTEGAWSYYRAPDDKHPVTPQMTCAGVATLFITQDYLYSMNGLDCKGNIKDVNIDKGLEWIAKNFDTVFKSDVYYTLYGIERIGVASGYKYFGAINWYEVGAEWLVKKQYKDGSWGSKPSTAFAMLFLSRGRAPVILNKLNYAPVNADPKAKPTDWNQRPRDAASISKWIGKQTERDLNWQIVTLASPVDEWHDSNILYIAGDQKLEFTPEEQNKIKLYVQQGGIVVGNADCANKDFARSFEQLGSKLFGAEFRDLDDKHPIQSNQQFLASKWKKKPKLRGLSNGARELMLLFPDADPAHGWQTQVVGGKEELYQAMANIALYSVDKKDLRNRGETFIVAADPKATTTKTLDLARVKYKGNYDPEPGGWSRLANLLAKTAKIKLAVTEAPLDKLGESKAKVADLTGTDTIKLSEPERAAVKEYVTKGGTLVIDSAGGSVDFAESLQAELKTIFGDAASSLEKPLAADDAIYKGASKPITEFGYRNFAKRTISGKAPLVRGISVNGRTAVLFSREDLSVGLVGQPVDGITGYDPATATAIMSSILQSVDKKPAAAATTKPPTPPAKN